MVQKVQESLSKLLVLVSKKSIIDAAENKEDSVTINIPRLYKKRIAEWLEDNEYTVIGVKSESDDMYIFWTKDLVRQMVRIGFTNDK